MGAQETSAGLPVQVLQELVRRKLDLLVAPLGSPEVARDDPGAVDSPEVADGPELASVVSPEVTTFMLRNSSRDSCRIGSHGGIFSAI